MNKEMLKISVIFILTMLLGSGLYAQWQQDNAYKFKINVPSNWSKDSYMDGTDKVWDFMSPDENAAVQVRAFQSNPQFTVDLFVTAYEDGYLPQGARRESLANHVSKQGIHGKQGIYTFDYNGINVSMGVFYAIKNNFGYVISAMIPTSMLQRKTAQVKQVTESFTVLGAKPKTGGSSLSGLGGGTMVSQFKITNIQLCSKLGSNNNAINPGSTFDAQTPEIHAVLSYTGQTSSDLTVSWIYTNWNRTITSDKYNFDSGNGGVGVVSLSKPNNGWPVGNYKVKFEMGGKLIDSKVFEVKEVSRGLGGLTGSTGNGGKLANKYRLESRSDGQNLVNYHYFFFRDDGYFDEKYQPKNSGNYVGGGQGTYSINGSTLTLSYDDGITQYLTIKGNQIIRTSSSGIIFTFSKAN